MRAAAPRGALAGLLLLTLAGLLAGCGGAAVPGPRRPKVLFIGIDGATWKVIGPMLARGELPAFRRLASQGASLPQFDTLPITLSPVIWTTIATGRAPEDHGVTSFTSELPNGSKIPVTSSIRKARAIWEVASRRRVSVGVIGWWASWPAEEVDGYDVTDHANPAFSDLLIADRSYWTADRATLARLRRDFLPLDIAPVLARHWISEERFPYDDLARRGRFTHEQMAALRAAPWNQREVYSWLKTFYRVDYPLSRIALDLAGERPTDLLMLYLRAADPVQHYGWNLVEPEKYRAPPVHLARDRGLIPGVYRYLDSFLGELLARLPRDSWVIVASDHGAEPSPLAMDPTMVRPGEHSVTAKGVLFVLGPGVKAGSKLTHATPYDLMPTMAWLLGLPLSRELPGKPLTEAFEDGFVAAHPMLQVPSYGPRPTSQPLPSPADDKMLANLKALGYIR